MRGLTVVKTCNCAWDKSFLVDSASFLCQEIFLEVIVVKSMNQFVPEK